VKLFTWTHNEARNLVLRTVSKSRITKLSAMQILAQSAQSAVFVKVITETCTLMLMQCEFCVTDICFDIPFGSVFVRISGRSVVKRRCDGPISGPARGLG